MASTCLLAPVRVRPFDTRFVAVCQTSCWAAMVCCCGNFKSCQHHLLCIAAALYCVSATAVAIAVAVSVAVAVAVAVTVAVAAN